MLRYFFFWNDGTYGVLGVNERVVDGNNLDIVVLNAVNELSVFVRAKDEDMQDLRIAEDNTSDTSETAVR